MADTMADAKLLEQIADWSDRFTPFVAIDPPHGLLLDITGAAHLFGGEKALLDGVCAKLRRQHLQVRGAIAGTSAAARALGRWRDGIVVPSGNEAEQVAPLPIACLLLEPAITHAFRRAGLKTIGQAAMRARAELVARFGEEIAFRLDSALGKTDKPINPRLPLPDYRIEHRFADPVTNQDVIATTLRTLSASLARLMNERDEGARAVDAQFFRADGKIYHLGIETGQPLCDPAMIERLFREKLSSLADPLDPGFGFDLLRLSIAKAERLTAETAGFEANVKEEAEIDFLIDRLAARFGRHRILRFHPVDTHIPEAAQALLPAQETYTDDCAWERIRSAAEAPRRPLRLFARPERIEAIAEFPDGAPMWFRWRRVLHDVTFAEGPERIAMEWWRQQKPSLTRDYFRVEDKEGRRFWLYREGLYGRETDRPQWFIHGMFA